MFSIVIDAFHPENTKRSERVKELVCDCQNLFTDAAITKEEIDEKLKRCNEAIKKAYEKFGKTPPEMKLKNLGENWSVSVSEKLLGVVSEAGTAAALRWAAANYLLRAGRVTSEKFAEMGLNSTLKVVIPKWLKVEGEPGKMICVTVAGDMIVDPIDGTAERDKLRKAIQEAAQTRLDTKVIDLYNRNLKQTLDEVIMSLEVFEQVQLPVETLEQVIQRIVDGQKVAEQKIYIQKAINMLAEYDNARQYWTAEG